MRFKNSTIAKSDTPSFLTFSAFLIFCSFLLITPGSANAFEVLLGTGENGSFSHFTGRMLCRTINRQLDNVTCKVQASDDEIDSLTNLQNGSLDLAIINSNVLDGAVNKTGTFKFLDINYENLAILSPLYDRPIGIIVRSNAGIATLDDLKGKRINGGAPGSIERRAMDLVMQAKGWTVNDFARFEELPTSHSQDTMAFCQGNVQAMITIGVHPSLSTQRLVEDCKAVFLDIDDSDIDKLVDSRPPCWKTLISASSYSKQAHTFGTRAMLVSSNSIDEEIGYAITQALYENRVRLQNSHPALSLYPKQESQKGLKGLKLNPGAEKFYSE